MAFHQQRQKKSHKEKLLPMALPKYCSTDLPLLLYFVPPKRELRTAKWSLNPFVSYIEQWGDFV